MGGRGASGTGLPAAASTSALTGLAKRIEDIYKSIVEFDGDWASITTLRNKLSDVSREKLDAELLRLLDADIINIAPNADQQTLTPADRKAAIIIGGKPKHLFIVRPPEDRE